MWNRIFYGKTDETLLKSYVYSYEISEGLFLLFGIWEFTLYSHLLLIILMFI